MKITDDRETQKQTKKQRNKKINKRRQKRIYCPFKLGFLQLICKASLVIKLNLELALSIILKQRE